MVEHIDERASNSIVRAASPDRQGKIGKIRRIAFYILAALFSILLLMGFWDIVPGVVLGWLPDSVLISLHPEFERLFVPHRVHQMAMHSILWGLVLGVVLQLYRPERRVARLLQALTFLLAFAFIEFAVGQFTVMGTAPFLVPLALITLLHPRSRQLVRLGRLDRSMASLTALAAIPWIALAVGQAELARLNLPSD